MSSLWNSPASARGEVRIPWMIPLRAGALAIVLGLAQLPDAAGQHTLSGPAGLVERLGNVMRGRVQLEGGYTFVHDRIAGATISEHVLPDLLLRVGLTDRLEVRLGWPGYLARSHDAPWSELPEGEVLDPNVGLMFDLFPQHGWIPQTAVAGAVPITLHGNLFAMDSFQPLGQVLYCWELGERTALVGTTGVAQRRDPGDDYLQFQQTACLDYLLTDRLDVFAEWEMLVDHGSADDGSQHMLGGGIGYLWTDALQVSWKAGVGLDASAPDFLTGIRFALRF